jgi:hypothetical protein
MKLQACIGLAAIGVAVATCSVLHESRVPVVQSQEQFYAVSEPSKRGDSFSPPAGKHASAETAVDTAIHSDSSRPRLFRESGRAALRTELTRQYSHVREELDLTDQEAAAFFDLLLDQLVFDRTNALDFVDRQSIDAAALRRGAESRQEYQRNLTESLISMLGAHKHEQWLELRDSQPDRQRVNRLQSLLAPLGRPLSSAQSRALTRVMHAESKQLRMERSQWQGGEPDSIARYRALRYQQLAESDRRVVEAASSQLDPQQLETLVQMLGLEHKDSYLLADMDSVRQQK